MKNYSFHLNWKLWVTVAMVMVLAFPALAQKITVRGTVIDEYGDPLIGATIMQKGTSNGTAADIDGNFEINVEPNATLVVSYVGYDPMDVQVNGRTQINIEMKENATMLNETVVIGYGSVKKSDATGSVAVVTPDDVDAGISTSAQDLLVGASPGVVVTTSGGDPTGNASIRIRGGSSLSASNDPLIVIDGVPQSNQSNAGGTNALTMLNPQNIESMTILKDASATAIYGSRASNGVIIITTKKGQSGRPQVNFAANFHVNTARKTLKMMKTEEYVGIIEKYGNDRAKQFLYANPLPGQETEAGTAKGLYDTDWQKEVLRTAFSQDYSLSVGGTAGFLPYRVNASFTDNQGIIKTSSMQRTTVGFNLSPKFLDDHLSILLNAQGSYVRTGNAAGVMGNAVGLAPVYPVMSNYSMSDPSMPLAYNGYFNIFQTTGMPEENASENPVQLLEDQKSIGKTLNSTGNIQIDYSLHWLPELHFNLNLGYQVSKNTSESIVNQNSIMAWRSNYKDGAGTKYDWYELQRNTNLSFFINYKKYFEAAKSDLDVTVGYDWQRMDYLGHSQTLINTLGYNMNYAGGVFTLTENPATADHIGKSYENSPMSRWASINQLVSFFGRVNYIFDDAYLLTVTLRNDGSSRFAKNNRWGLFPAVALGWKINNMPFMERSQGWLNDFKLRLGWGKTGQQDMDGMFFPYLPIYIDSYQQGFQYLDPTGSGKWVNPLYPQSYNADLKWETTTTWNVGLDMGFLNNRITLAADWYLRNTTDLLANVPTAATNTSNYQWRNIGSMENIGVEVTVGAKPVVTPDFTWNTAINVGWNKNKITKLQGEGIDSAISAIGLPSGTGGNLGWHIVGQPAYTFMVYEQVYDSNGDPIENQYVDQNADGVIDDNDLIMYHSRDPKVTLSWNNNFSYKDWDLGISLRANIGNYVYNNLKYSNSRIYNVSAAQYQLGNLMSGTPLFKDASSATLLPLSSYFVENASFLRCDNITLGYTFRNLIGGNLNLRLFAAVQNPFVITTFTGIDPEEFGGVQSDPYPRPITTTLGIVATF